MIRQIAPQFFTLEIPATALLQGIFGSRRWMASHSDKPVDAPAVAKKSQLLAATEN